MDNSIDLRAQILSAFSSVPHPGKKITGHRCEECDELRDTFRPLVSTTIPPEIIYNNFGQLPLFTPEAYRYFLPAYLLRCLDDFDSQSMVCEFVIYSLDPEAPERLETQWVAERHELFDPKQREAIASFLRHILTATEFESFHAEATDALRKYWAADCQ